MWYVQSPRTRVSPMPVKLGELRQAGLLTDGEFAAQKARLLA